MPHASNEESSRQLTDNEAHNVLARAAALDARLPDTVSYDALWSSAEAAGISRASFDQAAAELRAGTLGRRGTSKIFATALLRARQLAIEAGRSSTRTRRHPMRLITAHRITGLQLEFFRAHPDR